MDELSADSIKEKLRLLKEEFGVEHGYEELQKRFLQLQAIFRFTLDGQILLTKSGVILSANPAIGKLLGYTAGEMLEISRKDILDESEEQIQEMLRIRNEKGSFQGEIHMLHKSGQRIPVEISTVLFEIDQESFASVTVRDIRPRIAIEENRKKSEALVKLLMENTEESFFLLDKDLNIVSLNKTARLMSQRLLNKKPEPGTSIFELAQDERREELKELYAEVLCGIKRESEITIPQPDGGYRYFLIKYDPLFDEQGKVQGVFVNTSETTAIRVAELAFQKQKALFESLVQRTTDGTVILDTDGTIRFANDSSKSLLGLNPDAVVGTSGLDLVYQDDLKRAQQALADLVIYPDKPLEIEIRLLNDVAKPVWCELRAVNQVMNPHIGGLVVHFHDISARKAQEAELYESRKSLSQLLNNTEESFILCDRNLKVTAFNQAASDRNETINNRPMVIGESLLTTIASYRVDQARELARHVFKEGKSIKTTAHHVLANGSSMLLALEYSPVYEDDGRISGLCIIGNDVTDIRKAEAALLSSRQRLMNAQHIARLGSWDFEIESGELLWSDEVYNIYGLDIETDKPSERLVYKLVHPEDVTPFREAVNAVLDGRTDKLDFQHRLIHPNLKQRWLHQRGELRKGENGKTWLVGTVQDITEQKAIDHEMELSIERFRMVEMATNDVIWDLDLETDQLIWASTIERVFGYSSKDPAINDMRWWESKIHPEDGSRTFHSLYKHQHSNEKIWTEQYRFLHADGSYRDVLDRGYTVFDEEGKAIRIIGSMQDITETINQQRQIAEYADRLEGMVSSITDSFFTLDKQWRFSYLNPVAEKEFSVDGLSNHNKIIWEAFPELQKSELERLFRKTITGKKPIQFEHLLFGKWYAFNLYPQNRGLSVYARDISAKKLEEERLRLLESVITNTNDAILITEAEPLNEPGPRIVFVNEAFTRMTGYTAEEVLGKNPRILQGPETDRKVLDKLRNAFLAWHPVEVEVINYCKDGTPFWSNFSIVPIANEKGWYTHWISIQRNITERKEAEVAQKLLNEELMKQNYGLEQFSYITSHNLRAPVANLMSLLDLLDRQDLANPSNQELLDMIDLSAHRMDETLNELIKVLKIKGETNPGFVQVCFQEVYNRVLDNIGALLQDAKGIVATHFEVPEMAYAASHIESIMLNMLTNAIKYRSPDRNLMIDISSEAKDEFVVLSFRDNGLGIDLNRYKNRLFGMYQRFHNNADSRGLGLYIVHAQVQALGGKIEVDSDVGVGTTFRVYLKNTFDARINH